jgi:hypothetical protein
MNSRNQKEVVGGLVLPENFNLKKPQIFITVDLTTFNKVYTRIFRRWYMPGVKRIKYIEEVGRAFWVLPLT